ncbi:MAG TPA: hypothetical protein VN641_00215 [Urbifossiella sp.]|jgi:hypothetical protein|nr:hypothetical protein [Urbifossiella sp.]
MRKLLLSLVCMAFMAGIVIAAESYTFISYDKDKKEVTLKDKGGKEVTAKLTDDTKVYSVDKDGNKKEGKLSGLEKRLSSPKASGKMKLEATIVDHKITEVITKGGKKKKE